MSRLYKNKENYIGLLKACEAARDDFSDLKYCRNAQGEEYLVLSNLLGNVFIFDITGFSEAMIKHTLAQVECGIKPKNLVTDPRKRIEVAKIYGRKM